VDGGRNAGRKYNFRVDSSELCGQWMAVLKLAKDKNDEKHKLTGYAVSNHGSCQLYVVIQLSYAVSNHGSCQLYVVIQLSARATNDQVAEDQV